MRGKIRSLVFVIVIGGVIIPGAVLAFIYLHFVFALIASMFAALMVFGMLFGSRSPRQEQRDHREVDAAKRGDGSFFIHPRRPW